eukprot:GHVN01032713.1.p1 GENE.GHVN01032713.1~~GHVN01032713.1.p1  ORF type:complete len:100 (-),score=11.74 GHVN01032713.1:442-741(-)
MRLHEPLQTFGPWSHPLTGAGINRFSTVTMIDHLTKWAEAVEVPEANSNYASSAFIKTWVSRFGVPDKVISNNDQVFQLTIHLTHRMVHGVYTAHLTHH